MSRAVIRLVATDLDGTLWGSDLVVPDAHVAAIRALRERGIAVLVASSRRPRVAGPALAGVGLQLPAVLLDGAIGIDFASGERFHESAFGSDRAAKVLAIFADHSLEPCVYVEDPDVDVFVSANPSTCAAHVEYLGRYARTGGLDRVVREMTVYSFAVAGIERAKLDPVGAALREFGVEAFVYVEPAYGEYGLIVSPPDVAKWSGVLSFCALHDISPDEVLAVGDGENDIAMLDAAGVAVAVSGGTPDAVALADHVIDPPGQGGWRAILDIVG